MATARRTYRFQVSLMPQVRDRLDVLAKAQGVNRSAMISLLVNREWEQKGGKLIGQVTQGDDIGA